jgi:hypothetical protein
MAHPAPKGKKDVSRAAASSPRPAEPDVITEPLTAELIDELGSGGPWQSDDEFERWMDILADARRDDAA